MPVILKQVDSIIINGTIDSSLEKNLNTNQLAEESQKIEWVEKNPDNKELLFTLEDHELLQGQISIVGLDNTEYFGRFSSLFSCDWDKVDCALLTIGNYAQKERNGWRYQLGSKMNVKAWRNLFHKSANDGYERTRVALVELLSRAESFNDDFLSEIADAFVFDAESGQNYEWRYYYVKYPIFRPGSFGKYSWSDIENKPYEFSVMQTESKWSENTYQPFLKAVDQINLSKDSYGQHLVLGDSRVFCENSSFVIKDITTDTEISRIPIVQNEDGIDMEDRIIKLQRVLLES